MGVLWGLLTAGAARTEPPVSAAECKRVQARVDFAKAAAFAYCLKPDREQWRCDRARDGAQMAQDELDKVCPRDAGQGGGAKAGRGRAGKADAGTGPDAGTAKLPRS